MKLEIILHHTENTSPKILPGATNPPDFKGAVISEFPNGENVNGIAALEEMDLRRTLANGEDQQAMGGDGIHGEEFERRRVIWIWVMEGLEGMVGEGLRGLRLMEMRDFLF